MDGNNKFNAICKMNNNLILKRDCGAVMPTLVWRFSNYNSLTSFVLTLKTIFHLPVIFPLEDIYKNERRLKLTR
jgi:hypothetical protein